jgi:hypothetical protein
MHFNESVRISDGVRLNHPNIRRSPVTQPTLLCLFVIDFSTLFESYVIALDQRQEICSETNLILGKSLSVFHNVVQSSDLKIL